MARDNCMHATATEYFVQTYVCVCVCVWVCSALPQPALTFAVLSQLKSLNCPALRARLV